MGQQHTRGSAMQVLIALLWLTPTAVPVAQAQEGTRFMRDCAQWVEKKGYSVDYIEQRTGQRPAGDLVRHWRSNLEPKDVRAGDVVFLFVDTADQKGQRAEVVDEVLRSPEGAITGFKTSSMNIGRMVEPHCHVTENFGKVSVRRVPFDRVARAWRSDKQ